MQADALQAAMDALTGHRRELYRLRRVGQDGEAVSEGITAATEQLRELRRQWKLCARIEGDIPKMQNAVAAQKKDRSVYEKTDKNEPSRDSKTGSPLSSRDSRER